MHGAGALRAVSAPPAAAVRSNCLEQQPTCIYTAEIKHTCTTQHNKSSQLLRCALRPCRWAADAASCMPNRPRPAAQAFGREIVLSATHCHQPPQAASGSSGSSARCMSSQLHTRDPAALGSAGQSRLALQTTAQHCCRRRPAIACRQSEGAANQCGRGSGGSDAADGMQPPGGSSCPAHLHTSGSRFLRPVEARSEGESRACTGDEPASPVAVQGCLHPPPAICPAPPGRGRLHGSKHEAQHVGGAGGGHARGCCLICSAAAGWLSKRGAADCRGSPACMP